MRAEGSSAVYAARSLRRDLVQGAVMHGTTALGAAALLSALAVGCAQHDSPVGYRLTPTDHRVPLSVAPLPAGLKLGKVSCEQMIADSGGSRRYTVRLRVAGFPTPTSDRRQFVLLHVDVKAGGRIYPGTVSPTGIS